MTSLRTIMIPSLRSYWRELTSKVLFPSYPEVASRRTSRNALTILQLSLVGSAVATAVGCDTIPEENFPSPSEPPSEPYVVITLDDGSTYTDWSRPMSWYLRNTGKDSISIVAFAEGEDYISFSLYYEGDTQLPDELPFDREPHHSSLEAFIDGEKFTTRTAPGNNQLQDIHVDFEEQRITARFDVVLVSFDDDEPLPLSGTISTHQWNVRCTVDGKVDAKFESEFCQPFQESR